ncbi:hypothetical protein MVI01_34510 [Myxococcus virescens]|uniref:Uncharacterized protein n=1 Tax=Myxococcus virescens TaxID=83456 RepID=A0A511HDN5_9BACT|nr:hypothetical protein MVI01_34510 [Myxococcus virescens]
MLDGVPERRVMSLGQTVRRPICCPRADGPRFDTGYDQRQSTVDEILDLGHARVIGGHRRQHHADAPLGQGCAGGGTRNGQRWRLRLLPLDNQPQRLLSAKSVGHRDMQHRRCSVGFDRWRELDGEAEFPWDLREVLGNQLRPCVLHLHVRQPDVILRAHHHRMLYALKQPDVATAQLRGGDEVLTTSREVIPEPIQGDLGRAVVMNLQVDRLRHGRIACRVHGNGREHDGDA